MNTNNVINSLISLYAHPGDSSKYWTVEAICYTLLAIAAAIQDAPRTK